MAFEYKEFPLNLDLVEGTSAQSSNKKISLSQRDIGVSKILFSLTFRNVAYPIPAGAKVRLFIKRYNSGIVMQDQTAETGAHVLVTDATNGKIEVLLNSDSIANAGQAEAQIEIELAPGKIMTSQKFSFFVEAALGANGEVISGNDIPLLDKAIAAGEKLKDTDLDAVISVTSDVQQNTADIVEIQTDTSILKDNVKGDTNLKELGTTRNEAQQTYVYPTRLPNPFSAEAPIVKNIPNKGVDFIGHFYNDFGLEATASSSSQSNGAHLWYDWRWNFTTNSNYDPSRHPLLGWYAGDDKNTLDWQCFWLASKGVTGVSLVDAIDTSKWSNPSHKSYWQYVLFNQVKNFKSLKYVTWIKHTLSEQERIEYVDGVTSLNTQHNDMINNILAKYNNFYTYTNNGKKYPVVFSWDIEAMRGIYDNYNGNTKLKNHFIDMANSLKALGYDGICIVGRGFKVVESGVWTPAQLETLKESGVFLFAGSYETCYDTHANYGNSYSFYAATVKNKFPKEEYNVLNIVTSAYTMAPHPSGWKLAGSTPEDFAKVAQDAANHVNMYNLPPFITVYNVAEWTEGGPGLQPNRRDGFGYLDAIASVSVNANNHVQLAKYDEVLNSFNTVKAENITTTFFPSTGFNNTYTVHTGVVPPTGLSLLEPQRIRLSCTGAFTSGEKITFKITATFKDGTEASVEKELTAAGTYWLSNDEMIIFFKTGTYIINLKLFVKTTGATSSVTKSVLVSTTAH